MDEILNRVYFNNTVQAYLISLAIIVAGVIIIRLFKKVVLRTIIKLSKRTRTHFDDFVASAIERFGIPALYLTAIYVGLQYLNLTPGAHEIIKIANTVALTILGIRLISTIILKLLRRHVRRRTHDEEKVKQLGGLMLIINFVIWTGGLIFLFDNMGYNVTAMLTGLGIGGIAVALAAQNILGDLFNYFVIFFDRPFEVGDYIIVDEKEGEVEQIGIKTTRIRSLTGEQLVFANSDLTNSRIHNHKRMESRRVSFTIGVTYQTSIEKLKAIPGIIKAIIEKQEKTTFGRVHFYKYNDSSLDFQVVYFVLDADYSAYMEVQQNINFAIFEAFADIEVEFAYPTRTVYIAGDAAAKA